MRSISTATEIVSALRDCLLICVLETGVWSRSLSLWVPDVSYHNLFVTRRFVSDVFKRVGYLGFRVGFVLMLDLGASVRVRG